MALTKSDLNQIGVIVKQEVQGVKNEVKGVKQEVQGVKNEVKGVKQEVQGVKNEVRKTEQRILKKLEIVSQTLDKQSVDVAKRVRRIEDHLNLSSDN